MSSSTPARATIFKRRLDLLGLIAAGVAAVLAPPASSAGPTVVHAFVSRDGSTVVSGYDGGVPVGQPAP